MSIRIYCRVKGRKSHRVSVGFQLRKKSTAAPLIIRGDCQYITEAQAGAHCKTYRFKADAVISLPSAVIESKVLKMNCVWQIVSEQFILVCLCCFEFISNKGESGNWRGLVRNIKVELYTEITCTFKRSQVEGRQRGDLKFYLHLTSWCLSCVLLFEIFKRRVFIISEMLSNFQSTPSRKRHICSE